ncbi:MAG: amino acid transporter [Myxococcota bacterium]|jgi:amino acid transporter
MLSLSTAIFRQLLAWPTIVAAALWLLLSYQLNFNAHLGAASLGAFLSYTSLALSAIILRYGYVLQQRRQQGWLRQDLLRTTTSRAAVAEVLAALMALMLFAVCAQTMVFVLKPAVSGEREAYHPVNAQVDADSEWTISWNDQVPAGSKLILTFDFSDAPQGIRQSMITGNGVQRTLTAGEVLHWQLEDPDVWRQAISFSVTQEHNLSLIRPLARLVIVRPTLAALPRLLLNQLLFFFTVIALCSFIFRYLKVNGNLAALGALAISSLANLEGVRLLPDVGGLIAAGLRFEKTAFTTSETALLTWLGLGLVFIYFSCRQPRADKK